MTLQTTQTLRQLLRTRRFWATISAGSIELGLKYRAIPLHGVMLDIAFGLAWLAMAIGCVLVGLWQPNREAWGHEQKLRESMRRILDGQPPLDGYEYLLDDPPFRVPAPLPPVDSSDK